MSFKQAAAQYEERLEVEDGKSLAIKKRQLKQKLIPFFGDTALELINSFQIEQFKSHCRKDELSNSTVNRYLAVLSHLFNKAMEWGWLDKLPARVRKYKETQNRLYYITQPQVEALLTAAKDDDHPYLYPFIFIGLEAAMRKMEILSMRLEHIDLDRQTLYIPDAKAGARTQPLSAHLVAYLRDYIAHNTEAGQEWLFPSKTAANGHMVEIGKPFRRIVKAAGLDPALVVRHTLRHTAITHLVQAGVDLPTMKKISGHKTLQMVERYAHQNDAHVQEALGKLRERYGA